MSRLRTLSLILGFGLVAASWARVEERLALYLQGSRIGTVTNSSTADQLNGKPVTRNENRMEIKSQMLGSSLEMVSATTSWVDENQRPIRQKSVITSGGRTQVVEAVFNADTIDVQVDNNGVKSQKTLAIPKGAILDDDPTSTILRGDRPPAGKGLTVHVLDPTTVTLIPNKITYRGRSHVDVRGKKVDADLIEIEDPRMSTKVFLSLKGDLIKVEAAMGLEMWPESTAPAESERPTSGSKDLAFASAIPTQPAIERPEQVTFLRLEVRGVDLSRMPSDPHQTVRKDGDRWLITCKPVLPDPKQSLTRAEAARSQPNWLKPSLHIPSQDPAFRQRAQQIVGSETNVVKAAEKIRRAVLNRMTANAGIGVLRDAREVWQSQEGVCRDYAILMATLCRAADIPTRLVSGLISDDGMFYYHAWVEVWTGKQWVGLDATRLAPGLTGTHLKIAQGNVEEAFQFFLFEKATMKVLEVRHSKPGKAASRRAS